MHEKSKIFMAGLGGTIAAKEIGNVWESGHFTQNELLEMDPKIKKEFEIETSNLFRIHSADTQPEHWLALANLAYYKLLEDFDGIVVTHGTDTMHYTSAAMSFLIQNLNKPIVFTGSQVIPTRIGSDAQRNIYDSLRVAGHSPLAEVAIVFSGKIFRANRAKKVKAADFDAYRSSSIQPLGSVQHEIILNSPFNKKSKKTKPRLFSKLETNVCLVEVFPGMSPKIIESIIETNVAGIVIEGFGLGNYPVEKNTLTPAINLASDAGIPVVLTTQCSMGTDWKKIFLEEIGRRYDDSKVIFGYDLLSHTALVKLMWILAQTKNTAKIRKMMHTNFAGEISQLKAHLKKV